MVKLTRTVYTYEISLHDLLDSLGLRATKILDVKIVPEPENINSTAIVLTIEDIPEEG